jgi:hypothetical protein
MQVNRLRFLPLLAALALAMLTATGGRAVADVGAADPAPASNTVAADSVVAAHPPAPVKIRGMVRDANGSPIRGAVIRLMSEVDTVRVQSDGSGRFHARLNVSRGVSVIVQAYGYRDLVRSFRANGGPIVAALALLPPYPLGGITVSALPVTRSGPRGS